MIIPVINNKGFVIARWRITPQKMTIEERLAERIGLLNGYCSIDYYRTINEMNAYYKGLFTASL